MVKTRYQQNPDFIYRKIVDEIILVPVHQNVAELDCIYSLNTVGAFIWEQLGSLPTFEELLDAMYNEFEAEPEKINSDLNVFLGELLAFGAIKEL